MIKENMRAIGLEDHFSPHSLRHTRATHLAAKDFHESKMRIFFGWSKNSPMPSLYNHLSGADVDDAILDIYGIERPKDRKNDADLMKPKRCLRCGEENGPAHNYCGRCSTPLDRNVLEDAWQLRQELGLPELAEKAPVVDGKADIRALLQTEAGEKLVREAAKMIVQGIVESPDLVSLAPK